MIAFVMETPTHFAVMLVDLVCSPARALLVDGMDNARIQDNCRDAWARLAALMPQPSDSLVQQVPVLPQEDAVSCSFLDQPPVSL